MKKLLTGILIAGCSLSALAQSPIDKLRAMEGTWQGEGTASQRNGEKVEFTQSEEVTVLLDGKVIMYHGRGYAKSTGTLEFEAVGMIYYDQTKKGSFINAWTKDGQYTRAEVTLTDEGFIWSFVTPNGGTIRYTASVSEDVWKESGEYSPDSSTWYPFMSMQLTRD